MQMASNLVSKIKSQAYWIRLKQRRLPSGIIYYETLPKDSESSLILQMHSANSTLSIIILDIQAIT